MAASSWRAPRDGGTGGAVQDLSLDRVDSILIFSDGLLFFQRRRYGHAEAAAGMIGAFTTFYLGVTVISTLMFLPS